MVVADNFSILLLFSVVSCVYSNVILLYPHLAKKKKHLKLCVNVKILLKKTFFKIWKTEISKFVSKDFMGGLILYWYIEESYSKFFSKHLWMFWFFIDISRKVIHFVIRLNQKLSSFILFQDSNCAFSVTRPSLFLFYQSGINLVTIINFKYMLSIISINQWLLY